MAGPGRGTELEGDRGGFNTVTTPTKHALGVKNASPQIHNPDHGAAGTRPISDGGAWIAQIGVALSELLAGAQGDIIRREAANWAAYAAGTARSFLVGDGTDVESRVLENADLADPFGFQTDSELTIAAGQITVTQTYHSIDTQDDDPTDNLTLINGGAFTGQVLAIRPEHPDRTVVVQHNVGNIWLIGEQDISLEDVEDHLFFIYTGGGWCSLGDGGGGVVDADDVTYTPNDDSDWDGDADPGNVNDALDQLAARTTVSEVGESKLLFSQVVDVTVADTTDETTILGAGRGSKTLDADALNVGSVVVIICHGYLSDTGTPTLDLKVTLGGTEVCSTGAVTLAPTITDEGFTLRVELTCRTTGGAGTVVAGGTFEYSAGNQHKLVKTTATNVDTTAALAVDVTADWSAADAANTITCQIATIEIQEADNLAVAAPMDLTAVEV